MRSFAIDDRNTITEKQAMVMTLDICVSYAWIRKVFMCKQTEINELIDSGDLTGAIKLIIGLYRLPNQFIKRVGYSAKSLPITATAAMQLETPVGSTRPIAGTLLFTASKPDVTSIPRYRLLHVITHELAHARMNLDDHKLRHSEFATDVLALLVSGNAQDFSDQMNDVFMEYGYIRPDLYRTVFATLHRHAENIYL